MVKPTRVGMYFWRAYIKDGEATLWVDSMLNFTTVDAAEEDWKLNGKSVIRSKGYGMNQIFQISVMEHSH